MHIELVERFLQSMRSRAEFLKVEEMIYYGEWRWMALSTSPVDISLSASIPRKLYNVLSMSRDKALLTRLLLRVAVCIRAGRLGIHALARLSIVYTRLESRGEKRLQQDCPEWTC